MVNESESEKAVMTNLQDVSNSQLSEEVKLSFANKCISEFLSQASEYVGDDEDFGSSSSRFYTDDSLETYNRVRGKELLKSKQPCEKESGSFIFTDTDIMTLLQLRHEMELALNESGGRLSLTKFRLSLSLSNESHTIYIENSVKDLTNILEIERISISSSRDVVLLSAQYWETWIKQKLNTELMKSGGFVRLSDLAAHLDLPTNVISKNLKERGNHEKFYAVCTLGYGATYVVSKDYLSIQKQQVEQNLLSASRPLNIDDLIREMKWNDSTTFQHVTDLCTDHILDGCLHGNIYVPQIYELNQRKLVYDFLTANGYITMKYCRTIIDISSELKVREFIDETYMEKDRIIFIKDVFLNQDLILLPLETVVEESIANESFTDLKVHLPEDFVSSCEDNGGCTEIIMALFSKQNNGFIIPCSTAILFFSNSMVQKIIKNMMPELIQQHAQEVADAAVRKQCASVNSYVLEGNDKSLEVKSKSAKKGSNKSGESTKKRNKKNAKTSRKNDLRKRDEETFDKVDSKIDVTASFIPLDTVAMAIQTAFPNLRAVQEKYEAFMMEENLETSFDWKFDQDDTQNRSGGPLYDFCRITLDTPTQRENCSKKIQEEIVKLESVKRMQEQRRRLIRNSFEDASCYDNACYMIQLLSRLPSILMRGKKDPNDSATQLQQDFLTGFASVYARKITEYSIFKCGLMVEGLFHFRSIHERNDETINKNDELLNFCSPIDICARRYEGAYISCAVMGMDTEDTTDPLKLLREKIPGKVGVELARMWSFCGGQCYQGGEKTVDNTEITKKGNYASFLKHVREHSRTMVGKEFIKVEKKSEKRLLFQRRQQLYTILEKSSDPMEILDITIMLLFQHIQGIVIAGGELKDAVLAQLLKAKNIPATVKDDLEQMAGLLSKTEDVPGCLIENVRKHGLTRNFQSNSSISKEFKE